MQTLSILAFLISIVSVFLTGWAAFATARQARSARDQTKIQREQVEAAREQTALQRTLAHEALQPYVWADIQQDMQQGGLLDLVIGNSGPTVATSVKVVIDPPLPSTMNRYENVEKLQRTLSEGLHSLAPGRVLRWSLGPGYKLLAEDIPQLLHIRIVADGPHGPLTALEFPIDISQWRNAKDAPDGSLHFVRKSIQELAKSVDGAANTLARAMDDTNQGQA